MTEDVKNDDFEGPAEDASISLEGHSLSSVSDWFPFAAEQPAAQRVNRSAKLCSLVTEPRARLQAQPLVSAAMVGAAEAARICGISRTTWYSLKAAGRVPAPVRLGRRVLWRREELYDWMTAGCPPLNQWQRMRDQNATLRRRGDR